MKKKKASANDFRNFGCQVSYAMHEYSRLVPTNVSTTNVRKTYSDDPITTEAYKVWGPITLFAYAACIGGVGVVAKAGPIFDLNENYPGARNVQLFGRESNIRRLTEMYPTLTSEYQVRQTKRGLASSQRGLGAAFPFGVTPERMRQHAIDDEQSARYAEGIEAWLQHDKMMHKMCEMYPALRDYESDKEIDINPVAICGNDILRAHGGCWILETYFTPEGNNWLQRQQRSLEFHEREAAGWIEIADGIQRLPDNSHWSS